MSLRALRAFSACLVSLWLLPATLAAEASLSWKQVGETAPIADLGISETLWVADVPAAGAGEEKSETERIRVHRFAGSAPAFASVLYLPGTHMNGTLPPDLVATDPNLWLYLAQQGLEVFTLDYRTQAVSAETPSEDLGFMLGWTSELFLDDVREAAAWARKISGRERLFVAGFSRGAFFAYALAAAEPDTVAGVIALDGFFKMRSAASAVPRPPSPPTPPLDRAEDPWAAALAKMRAEQGFGIDVAGSLGWELRTAMMRAAAQSPEGPALGEPKAETGTGAGNGAEEGEMTVGRQVAGILHRAWGPGGLANPIEASPSGVSRIAVLARLLAGYDRWYPAIQDLEGRSIAMQADDPRSPVDDGWAALARREQRIPVLYFGATGNGPEFVIHGLHSAGHVGGRDVEIHVLEGYGHLDVLVAEEAPKRVFEPLLRWLLADGWTAEPAPSPQP